MRMDWTVRGIISSDTHNPIVYFVRIHCLNTNLEYTRMRFPSEFIPLVHGQRRSREAAVGYLNQETLSLLSWKDVRSPRTVGKIASKHLPPQRIGWRRSRQFLTVPISILKEMPARSPMVPLQRYRILICH